MSISENKKLIIKSGALAFTGNLVGKFVSLPVGVYVASVLNPAGYGLLSIVLIIIQYMSFLNLGMLANITREVPIAYGKNNLDEVKTIYNTVFTNYLITTLIGMVVLWILHLVGQIYDSQLSTLHFIIISFILITANGESFLHTYLKGEGKFLIYGQYELISKLSIPICTIILVYFFGFIGMLLSLIFTHILGLGFILYKIGFPLVQLRFNLAKTKELLSTSIFMYFNKMIDGLFISIIIILAGRYMTSADVGILSFALGFAEISKIPFATILSVTIDRKMAQEAGHFGETNYINYSKYFGSTFIIYLLFLTASLGIFLIFYSILIKMYLQEFLASIPVLIILFFAFNFYNARYFMNSYINITRQMITRSRILVVGVLINLIIGFISILLGYGIIGLAAVFAFSMIVISVQTLFIVFRQVYGNSHKLYYFLVKIFIISSLLTSLLYLFQNYSFVSYEMNYHDLFQLFFAVIDFLIKCIVFVILVFCLFFGLFRNDKVYAEIRALVYFLYAKLFSSSLKS